MTDDLPPAPIPNAVLEAAVYADDLDLAEVFYGELLGLPRIQRVGNRHVFFAVGASVLLVFNPDETEAPPGNPRMPVPPHGARGPGHVCLTLDREGIAAMQTRLTRANVTIDTAFDWPNGARSLYVRDPAGNSVEFAESWLWDDLKPG
ncbi:Glyoxalase/Bleomycin resistance protein/Dioxygenase superfamily protein [Cribrihabitans marinus]|jgi:catechol 2,3-dioxygenase-like lactoylglutathione lyase family enzyme|uniref:Glyoxalase/Bleomycin resistance protein/Dioxygenase superfamily protein n=1 Tax=Cribrihabitans marinus TaxID=1227549 RepID=A0A1H7DZE9_9RHOB|nr:VOC family protein [Cribrihabitans marinus]GGH17826.1 bleomycin resistance protein [Cribrihabitans marinus]SEK06948.1 Glyoxalase/Bleomycin resistance protein/Dioxygenase superfamily protein [Cribrihabitans marinus]